MIGISPRTETASSVGKSLGTGAVTGRPASHCSARATMVWSPAQRMRSGCVSPNGGSEAPVGDSTRPLIVLSLIDSLGTGGAERSLADALPYLRRAGIVTIAVALRPRDEGVQRTLQADGFEVHVLDARGAPSAAHDA